MLPPSNASDAERKARITPMPETPRATVRRRKTEWPQAGSLSPTSKAARRARRKELAAMANVDSFWDDLFLATFFAVICVGTSCARRCVCIVLYCSLTDFCVGYLRCMNEPNERTNEPNERTNERTKQVRLAWFGMRLRVSTIAVDQSVNSHQKMQLFRLHTTQNSSTSSSSRPPQPRLQRHHHPQPPPPPPFQHKPLQTMLHRLHHTNPPPHHHLHRREHHHPQPHQPQNRKPTDRLVRSVGRSVGGSIGRSVGFDD